MRPNPVRTALLSLAVLSLVGACSSDSDSSDNTFPIGKYIPVTAEPDTLNVMEFKSDGTYTVAAIDSGTYTTSGDVLTFETSTYCKKISPDAEKASYTWTWDGTTLEFTLKGTDKCTDRVATLAVDGKKAGT